jgi:hypothetical protein
LWGKVAELGIAFQRPLLLLGRQIFMLTQPLSCVTVPLRLWAGHVTRG